jgi:signal transduction histidine kinase
VSLNAWGKNENNDSGFLTTLAQKNRIFMESCEPRVSLEVAMKRPKQNQALLPDSPPAQSVLRSKPPLAQAENGQPSNSDTLEVRLPASLLERFTALLISSPGLDVLLEELLAGIHDVFDVDFVALYALEDIRLNLLSAFGQGAASGIRTQIGSLERSNDEIWTVLDTAHALFVDDLSQAAVGQAFGFAPASSLALLPLSNAAGTFGILALGSVGEARAFSAARRYALIATARVLTIPIERLLSKEATFEAPEASALLALSRLLEGVENARDLERAALEVLRPYFAGASLGFAVLEDQNLRFEDFEGHEVIAQSADLNTWHQIKDKTLLLAMHSSNPTFLDDYALTKTPHRQWLDAGIRAVAFVPILPSSLNFIAGNRALMALRPARERPWSETEKHLLAAAGRTIAISLERIHTTEALYEARSRAEFLAALSDALQSAQTADDVAQTAMRLLGPTLHATNIFTLKLEEQHGKLQVHLTGLWGDVPTGYEKHFLNRNVQLEQTRLTKMVLESNHAIYDSGSSGKASLGLEPIRDSEDKIIAILGIGRDSTLGDWRVTEKDLLARAAATVGLTLERAGVRERLHQARARAELLAGLSDALQTVQTAEEVAETAMRLLAPALNAKNIIILKLEHQDGRVFLHSMGIHGDLPEEYGGYFQKPGVPISNTVLSKQIVETRKAWYDTTYSDQLIEDLRARRVSVGIEPVKAEDGQVLALLSVGRETETGEWRSGERDLMARAAATIGLALERANVRTELEARNRALEEKSAEMESFVYSVSHDLKAPMVSLEGMSTLLEESLKEGDTSELEFFVSRLRANVNTMTALVNGLLELSRIGRIDETLDAVEVEKVIAVVLQELETKIVAKNLHIFKPTDWPILTFSPERLYQLMANLIGNAVKFTKPNTDIQINWEKTDTTLEFSIADNGPGIPNALKSKALDLFSRLDPSVEGTGVGLAMVKRILEISDGSLRLEDTPGGGLTVVFGIDLGRAQFIPTH